MQQQELPGVHSLPVADDDQLVKSFWWKCADDAAAAAPGCKKTRVLNRKKSLKPRYLALKWLQIDTGLLTVTSTDDELSGSTNIDDLEGPWN